MNTGVLATWVPGPFEIIIIFAIALLLFGRRLPEVGRALGKTIVQFKKGMREVKDDIDSAGEGEKPEGPTQG